VFLPDAQGLWAASQTPEQQVGWQQAWVSPLAVHIFEAAQLPPPHWHIPMLHHNGQPKMAAMRASEMKRRSM
jgi:hypothetical protein